MALEPPRPGPGGGEALTLNVAMAVPEPTSVALLGAGLVGLAWRRRCMA